MNSSSLEALRALSVSVHQDLVARWRPGAMQSRAYKRDRKFLATASESELLQELPVVGKGFDRSLCEGTEKQFNPADDVMLPPVPASRFSYLLDGVHDGDVGCIRAYRQIHLLFAKLELSTSPDDAIMAFVKRQAELPASVARTRLVNDARHLIALVLSHLHWEDIIPRHGPGSVATGEKPWEKMNFKRIYLDSQACYPADQYFFMNVHHLSDHLKDNQIPWEIHEDSRCKLVAVPKDFRGPRIIAMEPLEKQWIQQGQRRKLVHRIESHPLTRGYVNFASQDVNRGLALESSKSGSFATLDLKDASDRVSLALCDSIIEEPALSYLRASRSVGIELPSGEPVTLRSFSPMGSAICFPLESLIFYALALSAVHNELFPKDPWPTVKQWHRVLGTVFVYGDDIVVERRFAEPVIDALSSVGLVVNKEKCCIHGIFRESCGLDAYAGEAINPVRMKHIPNRRTPSTFVSSCSYLNEFKLRGMMNSYDTLMKEVAKEFRTVPFLTCHSDPCGIFTTSFTEAVNWNNTHFPRRYSKTLQRTEWRVLLIVPRTVTLAIPGWSQYLKAMTENPFGFTDGRSKVDDEYSIPHAVTCIKGWRTL